MSWKRVGRDRKKLRSAVDSLRVPKPATVPPPRNAGLVSITAAALKRRHGSQANGLATQQSQDCSRARRPRSNGLAVSPNRSTAYCECQSSQHHSGCGIRKTGMITVKIE